MDLDHTIINENSSALRESLLPIQDEQAEREGEGEYDDSGISVDLPTDQQHLVDGLPLKSSLLIKSLYFLDAL